MNRELAKKVADAVLYEGYLLYPYRPSALKNRQRWSFGIFYPPAYDEVRGGTERAVMHSECLLELKGSAAVHIQVRFLHLLSRQVEQVVDDDLQPVSSLAIGGCLFESWDEAVERSVEVEVALPEPSQSGKEFSFPGSYQTEPLRAAAGQVIGGISRIQQEVRGAVSISTQPIRQGVLKLTMEVRNETALPCDAADRNSALLRSLLSTHAILSLGDGEFVSLLDPPEDLRPAAAGCRNEGSFPVLVGEAGARDMLLCSPIILYDYPQIAPESAGDFYDATEIDEMLTLRVMTLSEQEKDEMRRADGRARELLQRTQESAREQLRRTHGAIRGLRPVSDKP